MKVYKNSHGNPFANFVLLASDFSGAKAEEVLVENKEEVKDKLPTGKFPVLEVEGHQIFESNAIARYIAKAKPESGLYGKSVFESSQVD